MNKDQFKKKMKWGDLYCEEHDEVCCRETSKCENTTANAMYSSKQQKDDFVERVKEKLEKMGKGLPNG